MSATKTYSQYIQYIKLMLGAVEDNEDSLEYENKVLTQFVETAFSEIEPYINYRKRFTVPWNPEVPNGLAVNFNDWGFRAKAVVGIRRGSEQGLLNNSTITTTAGSYYYGWFLPIGGRFSADYDPWSMQALMLKGINEVSGDKQFLFDYDRQYLFINFNMRYPQSVTVEYIPEYQTAEQIDDSYWQNIIQQYSLALVKISLSHYRGKFTSVEGSPYQLNYQKLEQEGKEEKQQIWSELTESNLLNYRFE